MLNWRSISIILVISICHHLAVAQNFYERTPNFLEEFEAPPNEDQLQPPAVLTPDTIASAVEQAERHETNGNKENFLLKRFANAIARAQHEVANGVIRPSISASTPSNAVDGKDEDDLALAMAKIHYATSKKPKYWIEEDDDEDSSGSESTSTSESTSGSTSASGSESTSGTSSSSPSVASSSESPSSSASEIVMEEDSLDNTLSKDTRVAKPGEEFGGVSRWDMSFEMPIPSKPERSGSHSSGEEIFYPGDSKDKFVKYFLAKIKGAGFAEEEAEVMGISNQLEDKQKELDRYRKWLTDAEKAIKQTQSDSENVKQLRGALAAEVTLAKGKLETAERAAKAAAYVAKVAHAAQALKDLQDQTAKIPSLDNSPTATDTGSAPSFLALQEHSHPARGGVLRQRHLVPS